MRHPAIVDLAARLASLPPEATLFRRCSAAHLNGQKLADEPWAGRSWPGGNAGG